MTQSGPYSTVVDNKCGDWDGLVGAASRFPNTFKSLSGTIRGVFQFYPESMNIFARVIKRRKSNKITHKAECILNKNHLIIIFL